MKATVRALLLSDSGQDLMEYSLLGALLSIVSLLALQSLGQYFQTTFWLINFQIKHFH